MVREIVKDPIMLSIRSREASREDMQTVNDLLDTIQANADRCVGMAANMIGVNKTILAVLISRDFKIMINPRIIAHSKRSYETEESCLSLQGMRKTSRYSVITVEYLDKKFKKRVQTFRDLEAQIIQHEIDHFNGRLI